MHSHCNLGFQFCNPIQPSTAYPMHLLEYFKTDKGEHGTCNSIGRDYPYSGYKQNIEIRNKYPPHFLPHKRKTPTETTNIEEIEKK